MASRSATQAQQNRSVIYLLKIHSTVPHVFVDRIFAPIADEHHDYKNCIGIDLENVEHVTPAPSALLQGLLKDHFAEGIEYARFVPRIGFGETVIGQPKRTEITLNCFKSICQHLGFDNLLGYCSELERLLAMYDMQARTGKGVSGTLTLLSASSQEAILILPIEHINIVKSFLKRSSEDPTEYTLIKDNRFKIFKVVPVYLALCERFSNQSDGGLSSKKAWSQLKRQVERADRLVARIA